MNASAATAGLDAAGLRSLLEFLERGRPPLAGYEAARTRLIDYFRWKGIRDPEAYADRTFDRVAKKLAQGEAPDNGEPLRYVLGVARFIYLEGTKSEVRARTALEQQPVLQVTESSDDPMTDLEACLETLHANERSILLEYHRGEGQDRIARRQALAEDLGINLNQLRIRTHRLRQRLEKCIEKRRADEMDRPITPLGVQ